MNEKHEAAPAPLAIQLTIASSSVGQPVEVSLELTNVSSAPVFVSSRLALHSTHAPAPFREVSFGIEGPDGKLRPFTSRVNRRHANSSDVKELAPGASLDERYNLHKDFDLDAPGTYRIRALYSTSPTADANGNEAWPGTAVSAWTTFTRVAP